MTLTFHQTLENLLLGTGVTWNGFLFMSTKIALCSCVLILKEFMSCLIM